MRKIVILLLFFAMAVQAQHNVIYKKFNSFNLNAERILKIYIPDSYEEKTENSYPIAVILDAEYLFDVYVANSKLFAARDKARFTATVVLPTPPLPLAIARIFELVCSFCIEY